MKSKLRSRVGRRQSARQLGSQANRQPGRQQASPGQSQVALAALQANQSSAGENKRTRRLAGLCAGFFVFVLHVLAYKFSYRYLPLPVGMVIIGAGGGET